ncbi:hypothetical protein R5H30_05225 [Sulfitobacter sp. D35]|uniref:hypothetical protein n=1 Tax=Sulfitobacter sp. D35 TaxID=3083252 RepID=UPI00296FE9E9|nr:hypothetical protein [Sulfitobacter sp. D35]MDW4497375.1 hypothetical protein [Sulfitobacter sp. D35]
MTLVALIDGPLAQDHPALMQRIEVVPSAVEDSPAGRHAAAMAETILTAAAPTRFLSLPVFPGALSAKVTHLVRALEAAEESAAPIVHCSLGLARDDPSVSKVVARLVASGRHVVAAAAARGGPVWPAALPGVISVQGDARCGAADWSLLDLSTARYGAAPRHPTDPAIAGASVAAAQMTGLLAAMLADGETDPERVLAERAAFRGRERRTG